MGKDAFIEQLKDLGFAVDQSIAGFVSFEYVIPLGRFAGQKIRIAFQLNDDLPATPPGGPHVSPRLLPINQTGGSHPDHGVHPSDQLGPDWEYWSRPFGGWAKSDRSAKAYMAHIRALFDFQ